MIRVMKLVPVGSSFRKFVAVLYGVKATDDDNKEQIEMHNLYMCGQSIRNWNQQNDCFSIVVPNTEWVGFFNILRSIQW